MSRTPNVREVEPRLSFNPSDGVRWSGWTFDSETISFAQTAYPGVKFVAADVICTGELFPAQFDIIYAFPEQQAALGALRLAAKADATLCLFDYLDRGGLTKTRFAEKPETLLWRPLSMNWFAVPPRADRMEFRRMPGHQRTLRKVVYGIRQQVRNATATAP